MWIDFKTGQASTIQVACRANHAGREEIVTEVKNVQRAVNSISSALHLTPSTPAAVGFREEDMKI